MNILEISNLNVGYGDLQVLWDVSLTVEDDHDIVSIVGPNGTGKTTLLKTLSGLLEPTSGRIDLFGETIVHRDGETSVTEEQTDGPLAFRLPSLRNRTDIRPENIVDLGFVQVTEGRNLFPDMTVHDNLQMGAYRNREAFEDRRRDVYDLFPVLEERQNQKAGTLSGGEQQMLAIGRGLITAPDLLALDEPSGALAPQLAERVFQTIEQISDDVTILLVEQHVDRALGLADYAYLLENGRIATEGTGDELLESDHVRDAYLSG